MTRATYLTFFGEPRGAAAGEHEPTSPTPAPRTTALDADGRSCAPSRRCRRPGGAFAVRSTPVHAGDDAAGAPAGPARRPSRADPRHDRILAARCARHGGAATTTDATTTSTSAHVAHRRADSPALITVPLIILPRLAVVAGYLNAAAFKIEKFTECGSTPGGGRVLPRRSTTPRSSGSTPCRRSLLVLAGLAVSLVRLRRLLQRRPLAARRAHRARRAAALAATRSWSTSTTSTTSTRTSSSHAIAHPIARAAYWFNQNVIDGDRQRRRHRRPQDRRVGLPQHRPARRRRRGQRLRRRSPTRPATALRPVQSGKVNQYGALLFGAAAIGALVLVIVNT